MYTQTNFLEDCLIFSDTLNDYCKKTNSHGKSIITMDADTKKVIDDRLHSIYEAELDYRSFDDSIGEILVAMHEYIKGYFQNDKRKKECEKLIANKEGTNEELKQYQLEINICSDCIIWFINFAQARAEEALQKTNFRDKKVDKPRTRKGIINFFKNLINGQ